MDARDIEDDAGLIGFQEMLDRSAGAEVGAAQIHGQHFVERLHANLMRGARDLDACVVDQDIQPTQLVDRRPQEAVHIGFLGDIRLQQGHPDVCSVPILADQVFSLAGLVDAGQVVHCDVGALLPETNCDRLTDALTGPRDEHLLSI